jgi:Tfp pilus assembly protein PilF
VVARFPDFADARVMLAVVELRRDQPNAAIAELRTALRVAPDSALAHYHLAAALERTGQQAEASAHRARALALDPRLGALPPSAGGTSPSRDAFSLGGGGHTP